MDLFQQRCEHVGCRSAILGRRLPQSKQRGTPQLSAWGAAMLSSLARFSFFSFGSSRWGRRGRRNTDWKGRKALCRCTLSTRAKQPRGGDHPSCHCDFLESHVGLQDTPSASHIPHSPACLFPRARLRRPVARFLCVSVSVSASANFGNVKVSTLRCRASAVYNDAAATTPRTRRYTCSRSRGKKD